MMIGIPRFTAGQRVEVRRRDGVGPENRPAWRWESGATFAHYARDSSLVVTHPDGKTERLPDGTWLRPDDKGGE